MDEVKNKRHSRNFIVRQSGFAGLLLVLVVVGLALVMSGATITKKEFARHATKTDEKHPASSVVTVAPGQNKNNLQLQTLAFKSPSICAFDAMASSGCICPDKQKWDYPGGAVYTDKPEQKCVLKDGRVNDECTLLKRCEQDVGACSWNAPRSGPGAGCRVSSDITGNLIGPVPALGFDPGVNCGKWYDDLSNGEPWCVGKPVIYLYPEKTTSVDVELFIPGEIYISDPHYPKGGWKNVIAQPDGTLTYQNKEYKELYYETKVKINKIPLNGVIISTSELPEKLMDLTGKLGLKNDEQVEFLEYWLPQLYELKKPYILFSVLSHKEKERIDGVKIIPTPDVFINFIAYFKGIDHPIAVGKFTIPAPPERRGFTVVEWGGTIDFDRQNGL